MNAKSTEFVVKDGTRSLVSLLDTNNEAESTPEIIPPARTSFRAIKPGAAEHNIQIEIHTHSAYGLILGRSKPSTKSPDQNCADALAGLTTADLKPLSSDLERQTGTPEAESKSGSKGGKKRRFNAILSLFSFATLTRELIVASVHGDPYADLLLLKIEKRMSEFDAALTLSIANVEQMIRNLSDAGVTARRMSSKSPARIELNFNSPYAMRLAMLIVKFDQLSRLYLPIRQLRYIDYEQWQVAFTETRQKFRQTVNLAIPYKAKGLTRESVLNKEHPDVARMIKLFGELPEDVLSGEKRPELIYSRMTQA